MYQGNGELAQVPAAPGFVPTAVVGARETAATAAAAQATAAVNARYVMALQKPRQHDQVRFNLLRECRRPSFAESAIYELPRGGKSISGPSIRFAEAAIRALTNVLPETAVVFDDDDKRVVAVRVTDLECNVTYSRDVSITKTVERRQLAKNQKPISVRANSYGDTVYIVPATDDEILMRENALVSKALRTLALRLIPGDLLDEAMEVVKTTLASEVKKDPDAARRKLLDHFANLNVSPAQIAEFLGHDTATMSPGEVAMLRGVWTAVRDGKSWEEATEDAEKPDPNASKDSPEARAAAAKRLAEARTTAAFDAYAAALKNCGIDDPAKAPLAQLEQALAILTRAAAPAPAATTAAPAAPAAAPAENPADFAKRKAAGGAAPQGGAT